VPKFTYENFLSLFYRIAVVYFDTNMGTNTIPSSTKLLGFLSRLELTKGFGDFLGYYRQHKSMNTQLQLTPPKDILAQLYLEQQQFFTQEDFDYEKNELLPPLDAF